MSKKILSLRGFTLSELLLVVTLIAVFAVIAILSVQRQTIRGYDAKRKEDFSKLRVIFEEYYNDHNSMYPTMDEWYTNYATKCKDGSSTEFLAPYLQGKTMPCDPVTGLPYLYLTVDAAGKIDATVRSQYKLFAALGNGADPDIPASGCSPDPTKGCGYVEGMCGYCSGKFNYGISMGNSIANPTFDFNLPDATPTPASPPGNWICPQKIGNQPAQNCQYYPDACRDLMILRGCATYDDAHKYLCSSTCNPGQTNVCLFLGECNL
jgi:prepilin-type N-terminal cleavage/methylation domain-containing protein